VKYVVRVQGNKKNALLCTIKNVIEFRPNPSFTPSKQMETFFFGVLRMPKDW
jgi:hypothetical protein